MNYGPGYAQAMNEKAKAEKAAKCNAFKGGVPIDIKACQSAAKYQADIAILSCSTEGKVNWSFSYNGNFYKESIYLPSVSYDSRIYGNNYTCVQIVNSSLELTASRCDTDGQQAMQSACQ